MPEDNFDVERFTAASHEIGRAWYPDGASHFNQLANSKPNREQFIRNLEYLVAAQGKHTSLEDFGKSIGFSDGAFAAVKQGAAPWQQVCCVAEQLGYSVTEMYCDDLSLRIIAKSA